MRYISATLALLVICASTAWAVSYSAKDVAYTVTSADCDGVIRLTTTDDSDTTFTLAAAIKVISVSSFRWIVERLR